MPTNTLLSIRPNYELVTRYAAAWQISILNAASQVGLPYIDLHGSNANSSNFFSYLNSNDPILVNIMGHGNYNVIACQNNEILLQGGYNTNALVGRVVYDLSCRAGRDLGKTAVSEGAISFLGYTEDFWIAYTSGSHPDGGMNDPLADEVSRGFFESHNVAPISYIKGVTIPVSYSTSQKKFDYWISVWEGIDSQVAALLVWNRDYQILHAGELPPRPGILPFLLMFAPLLLIPVLRKEKR